MEQTKTKCNVEEYLNLPEGEPYQLIGGKLTLTPAPGWPHQRISRKIEMRLAAHIEKHKLGELFYAPTDVFLSNENVFQPDLLFISKGREELLSENGIINGSPDLVIEILSPSTAIIDTIEKKEIYEKYGIKEYWIVDGEGYTVYVYVLKDSGYELEQKAGKGEKVHSIVVKNFELSIDEVFNP